MPSEGSSPALLPSSSGKPTCLGPTLPSTPIQVSSEASSLPTLPITQFQVSFLPSSAFALSLSSCQFPWCSCPMRLSPYPPHLLSGRRSFHPSCYPQAASLPASTLCQPMAGLQLQDPGEEEVYPCVTHSKALAGTQKQISAAPVRGVAQPRARPGSSRTEGRHQVASKRATAAPSLGLAKGHRSC